MDKQLLAALDNLSVAIEMLVDSLNKKNEMKSPTATALQSGDMTEQFKELNKSIQEIKSDTKKILDDQKTILRLQQEKKDKTMSIFEGAGKENSKKMVKDGVTVIALIAGAVLAIGLAFKLIGSVDWKSVIAISVALPMLAIAFEKVASVKDLTPMRVFVTGLALVGMSVAITLSSRILAGVVPIGLYQALTVVLIATAFGAVSMGLGELLSSMKDIKATDALKAGVVLPIVLLAVSIAIAYSSQFLQMVQPIGLYQALTVILIAAAFGVVSYGLGKLLSAFKDISPASAAVAALLMPIVLVALSYSIFKASEYFSQIKPIGLYQAFTAILIAITFIPLSYAVKALMKGLENVNFVQVVLGTIALIALSAGITVVSHILQKMIIVPTETILNFLFISMAVSASVVVLSLAVKVVNKLGNPKDYMNGGASIVIMATTIMISSILISNGNYSYFPGLFWLLLSGLALVGFGLISFLLNKIGTLKSYIQGGITIILLATVIMTTSHILSVGNYNKYPSLGWSLGVGLSLVAFGLAATVLGLVASTGVGSLVLLAGGAALIGIAGVIVAVDAILATGSYKKYPGLDWALGVGGAMVAFSSAVILLGVVNSVGGLASTLTLGAVKNPIDAGIQAVKSIAMLIPVVDSIISTGSYKKYPGLDWAGGVALTLGAFTLGVVTVGSIASISKGVVSKGIAAVKDIAQSIVDVSFILGNGKYQGGPDEKWAKGISLALGTFSPIYRMLLLNKVMSAFGSGGVTVEAFSAAIRTISLGIIDAASLFSKKQAVFQNPPPVAWAEGVGGAISAFSPVYAVLAKNSGLFKSGVSVEDMKSAILTISWGIIESAKVFSKNAVSFSSPPPADWATGVGNSIKAFAPIFEYLSKNSGFFSGGADTSKLKKGIIDISNAIFSTSLILGLGNYTKYPKTEWINGTIYALSKFKGILKMLNDIGGGISGKISNLFGGKSPLEKAVSNITLLAMAFQKLGVAMNSFSNSISTLDVEKLGMVKGMTSNVILLSLMDPDMLEQVLSKMEEKSGVFADLLKDFESKKAKGNTSAPVKVSPVSNQKTEGQILADKMDVMNGILADISSVVGSRGALKIYLNSIKENQLTGSSNQPNSVNRSDKRLKNILKCVGQSELGINIYHFTYLFDVKVIYQGIIAQELVGTNFENALVLDSNGFYSVDYSKIDVEFRRIN